MDQKELEDFVKSYTKSMDIIAQQLANALAKESSGGWKDWILMIVALVVAAMIATIWDMKADIRGLTEKATFHWSQINKNTGCIERIDKLLTEHVATDKARKDHKK